VETITDVLHAFTSAEVSTLSEYTSLLTFCEKSPNRLASSLIVGIARINSLNSTRVMNKDSWSAACDRLGIRVSALLEISQSIFSITNQEAGATGLSISLSSYRARQEYNDNLASEHNLRIPHSVVGLKLLSYDAPMTAHNFNLFDERACRSERAASMMTIPV